MAQQPLLEQMAVDSKYNKYIDGADHKLGIIASGIAFNYLMECYPDGCPYPVLKISQYPIPKKLIRQMTDDCEYVLIAEEGQPFIEDQVRGVMPGNAVIKGRLTGELPRTGELNPDFLKKALGIENGENYAPCEDVTPRHRVRRHSVRDVVTVMSILPSTRCCATIPTPVCSVISVAIR